MDYTQEQERQAQFLADNGVDLIIGSYPHVVEPVKWITAEKWRSYSCLLFTWQFPVNPEYSGKYAWRSGEYNNQ